MDYELKRLIAFCIIVKLVALSSEFSIRPETERLDQSSDTEKPFQLTSLAGVKEPPATLAEGKDQGMHFNLRPGGENSGGDGKFNKKFMTKSDQVRINSAFDTCEHMADLLESSRWRDIQKTLRWLNRILTSRGKDGLRNCRRKSGKMKAKFGVINKKLSFYSTKTNSKGKSSFEMKKFPDTIMNCGQNAINTLTPHNVSEQSEKLKKECKRKYKFGKNKLKHLYQKKPKSKTKRRRYFGKKISARHHLKAGLARPNNTESNSVASDPEKLFYAGKEKAGGTNQGLESKEGKLQERWPVSFGMRKSDGKNYKKENPWPNFVYHRVSSDLFHLGSTRSNHKQSAYVAISVNTSGESEAARNKNKIFGL